MARAQRKAALRDERFRRHQDGVRAGTESPGFLDRLESSGVLDPANPRHFPRYVNADWPLDARPDEASLRLASAWLTWVGHGPVAGPDGVAVRIWIRSADQDLPFGYTPGDQEWGRRRDIAASGNNYTALRPADIPAGPRPTVGLDHVLAEGIYGVGLQAGRGFGWLPRRVRAQWRRARTGRR
jgi:hypothetical protein